jgi:hypothetical protein
MIFELYKTDKWYISNGKKTKSISVDGSTVEVLNYLNEKGYKLLAVESNEFRTTYYIER